MFLKFPDGIAKTLKRFANYLSSSNSLCKKLVSLKLPTIFDDILKVTSVATFVVGFNLSSFESDNFTFTLRFILLNLHFYIYTVLKLCKVPKYYEQDYLENFQKMFPISEMVPISEYGTISTKIRTIYLNKLPPTKSR